MASYSFVNHSFSWLLFGMKMFSLYIKLFLCIALYVGLSGAKVFTPCEFALELKKLNVSRSDIGNLVCMVRHGTDVGINTRRMRVTARHNVEMGVFKMSSILWCKDFRNHFNLCELDCEKLVDDDISDDLECARKAMAAEGFGTFNSWTVNCQGRDVDNDIKDCGL